ncbi:MAG TPA: hypothetical protein VHZ76_08485 [Gammaproteobacteria bacterium]|nr:hypothetical protein [Gammaproteobacteria bacterium]
MIKINQRSYLCWIGFFILIVMEYAIFNNYLLREIIPYYPKSYDQTVYLFESYKLYEHMLEKGRYFKYIAELPLLPQTLLFHAQGAIFFLFFGASRWSALMINFIYFALLQWFSLASIKKITGRYRYGFIFVGLLLTAETVVMANDFRIDFIACCLYGILCCAILRSNVFLSRKWTWISLFISAVLIMMRYITVCYVLGIAGSLLVYYGTAWLINKYYATSNNALNQERLKNLFIFIIGLSLVIVPLLWVNRDLIYNYYIVGHLTGEEKFMRLQAALQEARTAYALLFYPKIFFTRHFSLTTLAQFATILTLYAAAILFFIKKTESFKNTATTYRYKDMLIFLLIATLVPLFVLSMDTSKSILVISIILVPFLYLLVFSYIFISEKLWSFSTKMAQVLLTGTAVFFLFVGLYNFSAHLNKERYHAEKTDKDFVATAMINDIGHYVTFLKWQNVSAAADYLGDYINAPVSSFYYEQHGFLFDLHSSHLGNNAMTRVSKETALNALAEADMFTTNLQDYSPDKIYPFERSIQPFRSLLQQIAANQMIKLGDYYIFNAMLRVYVRPDIRITGIINNWITSQGVWLEVPAVVAQQIKTIRLTGESDFTWLKNRKLTVQASTEVNGQPIKLNAQLTVSGKSYQITCRLPAWQSDKPLIIYLTFNDYFEVKANAVHNKEQPDKLVMRAPDKKIFLK